MIDRLQTLEQKFDQLAHQMADPGMAVDQDRYRQTMRSYHDLEKTILTYREYKEVLKEIRESEQLLADDEMKAMAREELNGLEARREALTVELRALLLPKDPNDERNVILEIRAGTGGEEAALVAAELDPADNRHTEARRWEA